MLLKPWYDVVTPRRDLCEEMTPEALEFAVHLNKVRDCQTVEEYTNPELFFIRTHLTTKLIHLVTEVVRRLSGETMDTHAVFWITSPFGDGKTHALTLLYHLAKHGHDSHKWLGVPKILSEAGIQSIPEARMAVFVGTEFDSLKGRGGKRGEPRRKTPWGEIAFQLGGEEAFAKVAEHDKKMIAPGGEVIRDFLPHDTPCLILIDELINYLGRYRSEGMSDQFYHFLHNFSEQAQSLNNVVLAVSIPSLEDEMETEDEEDIQRYSKMLDRIGSPVIVSAENETPEIIRRRLFNWDTEALLQDGSILLPDDAIETCIVYGAWVRKYRIQLPVWFPFDQAEQAFMDTYPFHPSLLSVFETKWQILPHFQHTRGILRLMTLLIANAYKDGYSRVYSDSLIGLGTAPLDDMDFREGVRTQLSDDKRLESAMMTDICGRDAFVLRLDSEASDEIKHNRLHLKTATTIFFESNGGINDTSRAEVTESEIRLAVGEPDLAINTVETVLESLADHCYYLTREDQHYRFNLDPNLNKHFADCNPNIDEDRIADRIRIEIQKIFANSSLVNLFPEKNDDIPDRPILSLAVLSPEYTRRDPHTFRVIDSMTKNYGSSDRTFKSAIIWVVADDDTRLNEETRKLLTWQDILEEVQFNDFPDLSDLDPAKITNEINIHIEKVRDNLREIVWQTYKHIALLNKEHKIEFLDLGRSQSSAASSLSIFILNQLRLYDYVVDSVSPRFLTRNWPLEFRDKAWSTKAVRDMFFASPLFPRLLNPNIIKETIAKGASNGYLAYVGLTIDEKYEPFYYQKALMISDVEISDDIFIIAPDTAENYLSGIKRTLKSLTIDPPQVNITAGEKITFTVRALDEDGQEIKKDVLWEATGGTIDQKGIFNAGEKNGNDFEVRATAGDKSAWVKVSILSKKPESPEALMHHSPIEELQEEFKEETAITHLSWSGEVTGVNWADFYTKVLSRFATDHTMKVRVNIEVLRENGISPQNIREMKTALRKLGLNNDVQEK